MIENSTELDSEKRKKEKLNPTERKLVLKQNWFKCVHERGNHHSKIHQWGQHDV
jgi:hypothetical protein